MPTAAFRDFLSKWGQERASLLAQMELNKAYNSTLRESNMSDEEYENNRKSLPIGANDTVQLLQKTLPTILYAKTKISVNEYLIEGSVGKGEISEIPWLGIFDKTITITAKKGFYIVYLFKADLTGFYLSLNQGWDQYKKAFKPRTSAVVQIKKNTAKVKTLLAENSDFSFEPITLRGQNDNAEGYELGNICSRYYPTNKLPSEDLLVDDLKIMIRVYGQLKSIIGKSILNIQLLPTEEEYQDEIQEGKIKELPPGKVEKKLKKTASVCWVWPRDKDIAFTALEKANHKCEVHPEHSTFISRKTGNQFMEAHHLIPMEFQDDFEVNLDVPENIISVCPNCHRAFHHSDTTVMTVIVKRFLEERKYSLIKREIEINEQKLVNYYLKISK